MELPNGRAGALLTSMLDPIANSLEKYMDLLSMRQKLIASNIANVDTPGYKTRDVDFESEFQSMLRGERPEAKEVGGLLTNNDGNNVNIDREARLLSENGLRFSAASQLLRSQFNTIRMAINEGKS
jgi:flagellar basal-body rod protein FlgB